MFVWSKRFANVSLLQLGFIFIMLFESDASYAALVKSVGVFFIVFASFFSVVETPLQLPVLPALLAALFAVFTRYFSERPKDDRPTISIVVADFRIKKFAIIGILSLFYAISFGVLLGSSTSYLVSALVVFVKGIQGDIDDVSTQAQVMVNHNLALALICFVSVFVVRIFCETYVVLFRVSQKYLHTNSYDEC